MSKIENKLGHQVGNKEGIYPTSKSSGDSLAVDGGNLIMRGLGIGVLNAGASDITLSVVLSSDDESSVLPVVVPAGTSWQGGFFNCVAVAGSTGHADSTTHYLYA